jgi:membrane-associated HD superfamily phosphohydrolase
MEKTSEILRDRLPRVYSRELVEILYSNVYTKIANLVDAKIASRNIADNYLAKLEELGIIKGEKVGREKNFINRELFEILKEG